MPGRVPHIEHRYNESEPARRDPQEIDLRRAFGQNNSQLFVIDDNECVRCGICIDRCPTGALWYARVGEGKGAAKG